MAKPKPKTGKQPTGSIAKSAGKPTFSLEKRVPKGLPRGAAGSKK